MCIYFPINLSMSMHLYRTLPSLLHLSLSLPLSLSLTFYIFPLALCVCLSRALQFLAPLW
jgi:hypothetical protein